jgi:hypothetical protein
MDHIPVQSSSITSIAHEGDTLELVFRSGARYRYHGVSAEQCEALRAAKSVGGHFAAHIRGRFEHEVVPDDKESPA